MKPKKELTSLDWAKLLREAAEVTLCPDWEACGVSAIQALAIDLASYYAENASPIDIYDTKARLPDIAQARRLDAASFLTGLAAALGVEELHEAAWLFERAADMYGYTSTLMMQAIDCYANKTCRKTLLKQAAAYLYKAAQLERKAAEKLLEASKKLEKMAATKKQEKPTSTPAATEASDTTRILLIVLVPPVLVALVALALLAVRRSRS